MVLLFLWWEIWNSRVNGQNSRVNGQNSRVKRPNSRVNGRNSQESAQLSRVKRRNSRVKRQNPRVKYRIDGIQIRRAVYKYCSPNLLSVSFYSQLLEERQVMCDSVHGQLLLFSLSLLHLLWLYAIFLLAGVLLMGSQDSL